MRGLSRRSSMPAGFALVEVLVALLVFSIAIAGGLRAQLGALSGTRDTLLHLRASRLLQDLVQREGVEALAELAPASLAVVDGTRTADALRPLGDWASQLQGSLAEATLCLDREDELVEIRRHFGYSFQGAALFDSMTVEENIAFPLREVLNMKDQAEIRRLVKEQLEWIGLPGIENKNPAELSGGMKKRVGVARTLVTKPEVLLFDEPTTGLDPVLGETINDLVLRVNQELGLTCILITHDIQATFRISDKIAFLHNGKIAEVGTPREVASSDHQMVRRFIENSFNSLQV